MPRGSHLRQYSLVTGFQLSSLYRKWRSRSFDDLFGQEHVTRTLRNAVAQGRVAHAYLFTGPRGTGKTSTARILAKAVNCLNPQDGNPCNECPLCIAAEEGRALDVIEIDAASNTSVENVRELRERVGYAAGEAQHKVYIVDEVHRLSAAAFDAFLKTLEEPPEHVIFVFASTEPHKVPATIMSRCQRFDFRRHTPQGIHDRLRYVAGQEHIDVTDDALVLMAQGAQGSMRDALGLLDQVSAYTDGAIDATVVRAALGLMDPMLVARLVDHAIAGEVGKGLADVRGYLDAGGDPGQLMRQYLEYWRAVLLASSGAPTGESIDPALHAHVTDHAQRLTHSQIVAAIRAMTRGEFSPRFNLPPELPFEVGYVDSALSLSTPATPAPRASSPVTAAEKSVSRTSTESAMPSSPPPPAPAPRAGDRPEPAPSTVQADISDLDGAWNAVRENMRTHSKSLQAVLKSAYLMKLGDGELTIGCLYPFHHSQLTDVKKRKLVEQVVAETLGTSYRVRAVLATREEIEAARGAAVVPIDDGFIQEAAERVRQYYVQHMGNGQA